MTFCRLESHGLFFLSAYILLTGQAFAQTPTITSIVNSASSDSRFSPGVKATISCAGVVSTVGASVMVGGVAAYVFPPNVSDLPTTLSIQLPYDISVGSADVVFSPISGGHSAPFTISMSATSPALFASDGVVQAYDVQTNRQITAIWPAYPGEQLYIDATGLGPTNPPTVPGPTSTNVPLALASTVTLNGLPTQILSGFSYGGLDRIQLVVPTNAPSGLNQVVIDSGGNLSPPVSLPVAPVVMTSISPSFATVGAPSFTLMVNGYGFLPGATVQCNGSALPTTFVNNAQLTATVAAGLTTSPGALSINVLNPGGGQVGPLSLIVVSPGPVILLLNPFSAVPGGPAFTLTVGGYGFLPGATVQWNGSALPTTFVNGAQLNATVAASFISSTGNDNITVSNQGGAPSGSALFPVNSPVSPVTINSLSPTSAIAGANVTVTINGTGFQPGATAIWTGSLDGMQVDLPTTFVSPTQLKATVSFNQTDSGESGTIVVVSGSTGAVSGSVYLPVNPTIASLSPGSVTAGSADFTLTVNGIGFLYGATLQWNGTALPATVVASNQLTASVAASLVSNPGNASVVVVDPGGTSFSASASLPIFPSGPVILSLNPSPVAAAGAAFTLIVGGLHFAQGATVLWNGSALATTVNSSGILQTMVAANLIASVGSASIVVVNPDGSSSTPFTLQIVTPVPAISSLTPSSATATGATYTLTVNGTGFLSGATVEWNGSALPTTHVSGLQLTASVAASLIAGTGAASITVLDPGGILSNAVALPITEPVPVINTGGVVPVYSSVPTIESGSWFSIYGSSLANGPFTWNGSFPMTLGGVSVSIDNKPAYLWYVSPSQINAQAPDDTATGTVNVVLTSPLGSATSTVTLSQYAPSFSLLGNTSYAAGIIATPDGSGAYGNGTYDLLGPPGRFSFATRAVSTGETLELYGVGFGPTDPPVPAGQIPLTAAPTTSAVTVTIGGVPATVLFSGITEAGTYQINIRVPATGSGDQLLKAMVGGAATPDNVMVTVR
jgi:uncharacterized protein (TIGR03437 family)